MPGETAAEILSEDDFSKAFADSALELTVETPPAKEEPPAKQEPVKEEPAAPAAAAPAAEEPPAKQEPVKEEPAVVPAAPASISEIISEVLKATKKEEPAPAPEPEPEDPPEVVAALAELESNWGTHKIAIETLLARQEKKLTAQFQDILKPLQEQVQATVAVAAETAADKFKAELTAIHSDAYDLAEDIDKWIEAQPAYLQPAYTKVLEQGSAKEVAEFITAFKTATGKTAAPDPAAEAAAKAKAEADAKLKAEKLEKMEVTSTARTSVTAEADPVDFDSAWSKGAKTAS